MRLECEKAVIRTDTHTCRGEREQWKKRIGTMKEERLENIRASHSPAITRCLLTNVDPEKYCYSSPNYVAPSSQVLASRQRCDEIRRPASSREGLSYHPHPLLHEEISPSGGRKDPACTSVSLRIDRSVCV